MQKVNQKSGEQATNYFFPDVNMKNRERYSIVGGEITKNKMEDSN